jgi:malto-oligosyltrehalose trehalohydrolase
VDPDRHVHLVLENELNEARRLVRDAEGRPRFYTAQWNDDAHHCLHVLATGESEAYYGPYAEDPAAKLVKALASGFVWQGEPFGYWDGEPRGEPSATLPPTAFVNFLQNHDQIGNRALGERLDALAAPEAVAALLAVVLLAPQVPMLFMGEEYAAPEPFLFFTDFDAELGEKVRDGRRAEFAGFAAFADPDTRARIPDPNDAATFARTRLDTAARARPPHADRTAYVRRLLRLRAEQVAPRLAGLRDNACVLAEADERSILVAWRLDDDSRLELCANLGERATPPVKNGLSPEAHILFATHAAAALGGVMPPWSVVWRLQAAA